MKQEKTYKMVGFFVVIGFISFIAIIYNYLSYKFSTDESNYVVMYFDESIQGLNVGSPVMFKGVEIGKVAKIRLLTNIKEGTWLCTRSHQRNQCRQVRRTQKQACEVRRNF